MAEAQKRIATSLKQSFSHVKEDITTLQKKQEQESHQLAELQRELAKFESLQSHSPHFVSEERPHVSVEELDAVKARITDVQITLKKLHALEKQISLLDKNKATQQEFSAETKRMHAILDIKRKQIEETIQNMKEYNARFLTKEQAKELLDEFSQEMSELWTELNTLKTVKDQLTLHELNKKTAYMQDKYTSLLQHINGISVQVKTALTKQEFNAFMRDLNKELMQAKKYNEDVHKLTVYLANIREDFVTADQLNTKIEEFNLAVDQVQRDTNTFRKETVDRKELHKLLEDVRTIAEKKVDSLTDNFNKRITEFNNTVESIQRDTNIFRRETVERREFKPAMEAFTKKVDDRFLKMQTHFNKLLIELDKNYVKKREHSNLLDVGTREVKAALNVPKEKGVIGLFVGNMFIISGFLALIAGIVLYFMNEFFLTNYFAFGAIIVFVIGLIIRIVSLTRKE